MEDSKKSVIFRKTKPYQDQKAGTSGLRKKVKIFQQANYTENFIQSIFNAVGKQNLVGKSLIVSGDGRYYNKIAIQKAINLSAANGLKQVIVGEQGLLSTPAVSSLIMSQNRAQPNSCVGAILLTASHNPGGPQNDFGVKFNSSNGGPALESLTQKIYQISKQIEEYLWPQQQIQFSNFTQIKVTHYGKFAGFDHQFSVKLIDCTQNYVALMKEIFDFQSIKGLCSRSDFNMTFDAMHGVAGPYATKIFGDILNVDKKFLICCDPLEDFGGLHPDPNLVYAKKLVKTMGLCESNQDQKQQNIPDFGAACDGDADRNMILGKKFFVTPSDSLAVIAANSEKIPYFKKKGGLKGTLLRTLNSYLGVARSMPTSKAIDQVSKNNGLKLFQTPTGWKFFGNLMDAGLIQLCGQESFGTGSDHIRQKDGIWAVLAWLQILADRNRDQKIGELISIENIVKQHWAVHGRNFYSRYDYEGLPKEVGDKVMEVLKSKFDKFKSECDGNRADIFEYEDPVDNSISKNQGIRFIYSKKNARIIFRLSGTGSVGATIRIYFERVDKNTKQETVDALEEEIKSALELSEIHELSARSCPTVIT